MKGVVFYCSATGNSQLVANVITSAAASIDWDLHDCLQNTAPPPMEPYQICGFVCSTFYFAIPPVFEAFIERLPRLGGRQAFVVTTFGMMVGGALKYLTGAVEQRGAKVVAAHALHTPENYPPFIQKGWAMENAPDAGELSDFAGFVQTVAAMEQQLPRAPRLKKSLWDLLLRPHSRKKAYKKMGALTVKTDLCLQCGQCSQGCPYGAITQNGLPEFCAEKCWGCFRCYNRCPQKAIFAARLKTAAHYPEPLGQFRQRLVR